MKKVFGAALLTIGWSTIGLGNERPLNIESFCMGIDAVAFNATDRQGDMEILGTKRCPYRYGSDTIYYVKVINLTPEKKIAVSTSGADGFRDTPYVSDDPSGPQWYHYDLSAQYAGPLGDHHDLFIVRQRFTYPQWIAIRIVQGNTVQEIQGNVAF